MKYQLNYEIPDGSKMTINIELNNSTKQRLEYEKQINIPKSYFNNPEQFLSQTLRYDETQKTVFESQTLPEKMETLERLGLLNVSAEDALKYMVEQLRIKNIFI